MALINVMTHPAIQQVKVAVDNCIFTVLEGRLHLLLIQMTKVPYVGMWALPGGLIQDGEALDAAAARILDEATGVTEVYLEQLYTFGQPARDPAGQRSRDAVRRYTTLHARIRLHRSEWLRRRNRHHRIRGSHTRMRFDAGHRVMREIRDAESADPSR